MKLLFLLVIVLACACPVCCCGPARADGRQRVSEEQVREVQNAIRWRRAAWSPLKSWRITEALNKTREPLLTEAVCINESDLREDVVSYVRPGVYDVGLCGIRCVLDPAGAEASRRDGTWSVRSVVGNTSGRCQNGSVRGYTIRQLLDGPTSIRLADEILHDTHGGSLRHYNGGTREHGYAGRVGAILAALGGVDVFARRRHHKPDHRRESRVEKLTRQIIEAVAREKKS